MTNVEFTLALNLVVATALVWLVNLWLARWRKRIEALHQTILMEQAFFETIVAVEEDGRVVVLDSPNTGRRYGVSFDRESHGEVVNVVELWPEVGGHDLGEVADADADWPS